MNRPLTLTLAALFILALTNCFAQSTGSSSPRIIELTADKDSRYRQNQKAFRTIEVLAGEPLVLRVTAVRAKEVARDGSVHGLALLDQNSDAVPGWRFFFRPGDQEVRATAPTQPGRYTAVCTVICSDAHEGMSFILLVTATKKDNKE